MSSSKVVLSATTVLGLFGMGWLIMPDAMGRYWGIALGDNFDYMGHRYGALLVGLAVTVWLARNALNTQARRALMLGAFVSLALTTALSLYGALALRLHAWAPFVIELTLTVGLMWVLFVKSEPVV